MKVIKNSNLNVVNFRTLKAGDVFTIKDDPDGSVFIRTSALYDEHNAVNLSDGELMNFHPDDENFICHSDAFIHLNE